MPPGFLGEPGEAAPGASFTGRSGGFDVRLRDGVLAFSRGTEAPPCLELSLVGANAAEAVEGETRLAGRVRDYRGDASEWNEHLALYREVIHREVYPGIDLVYTYRQGSLKREFIVAPGSDPTLIRLNYAGASGLETREDGALAMETSAGEFVESAPVAFQEVEGRRELVEAGFAITGGSEVSFQLGEYDRTRELVIDPELTFVKTFGGSSGDTLFDVEYTEDGIYVVGITASADFPVMNAFQGTYGGDTDTTGAGDIFVAKLEPATKDILWATYLGGSETDFGNGIVVDNNGLITISGWTKSADFPVTNDAFQSTLAGASDGIIARFDSDGQLLYSTYFGGTADDQFSSIEVIRTGLVPNRVGLTGFSASSDFPVPNGKDTTKSGPLDLVVVSLDPNNSVVWSTFVGGSGSEVGLGITIGTATDFLVVGWTDTANFANPLFGSHAGMKDALLVKVDRLDSQLKEATKVGGANDDMAFGVAYLDDNNIFVAGTTLSDDFKVLDPTAQRSEFGGGVSDGFITRFDSSYRVRSSGYLGGAGEDQIRFLFPEGSTSLILGGATSSTDFPVLAAFQETYGGGDFDAWVGSFKLTRDSFTQVVSLEDEFFSYFGGSGAENTFNATLAPTGDAPRPVTFVGGTGSTDLPAPTGMSSGIGTAGIGTHEEGAAGSAALGEFLRLLAGSPDLKVTISVTRDQVPLSVPGVANGDTVNVEVVIENIGDLPVVVDAGALTFDTAVFTPTDYPNESMIMGNSISIAGGRYESGDKFTYAFKFRVTTASFGGQTEAVFMASSPPPDIEDNVANNQASATVTLLPSADLKVTTQTLKVENSKGGDGRNSGGFLSGPPSRLLVYRVIIENLGPEAASNVRLEIDRDDLGPYEISENVPESACVIEESGREVCTFASLASGQSITIEYGDGIEIDGGIVRAVCRVSADQLDNLQENNVATLREVIVSSAVYSLAPQQTVQELTFPFDSLPDYHYFLETKLNLKPETMWVRVQPGIVGDGTPKELKWDLQGTGLNEGYVRFVVEFMNP